LLVVHFNAFCLLIIATLGVSVCSHYFIDSVDGIVEVSGISRAFIGLIIVTIVGNAGEYATAVNAAMKDDLNLAIAVVVESTFQIALFVTPFLVILGWIMARPMALCFDIFVITVFFLDVVVVNCLTLGRRTNCLEGALLIGT
jgi:Ca2+:H+ antiporter